MINRLTKRRLLSSWRSVSRGLGTPRLQQRQGKRSTASRGELPYQAAGLHTLQG
jgi:hypothetical protein